MADYYPVLVRAVARLANNSTRAREALYENARAILEAELRQQVPRKSARDIVREQAALEAAIRRVEVETASKPVTETGSTTKPPASAAAELDEVLKSIGIMLLGMACVVTMLAFAAVLFIRGLVLVHAKVIGYPTLVIATTIVLGLYILLFRKVLRKMRIEEIIHVLLLRVHRTPKTTSGLSAPTLAARIPARQ